MEGLEIRPVTAADEAEWRRLWTAYLAFYETVLPEEVFRYGKHKPKLTWSTLDSIRFTGRPIKQV